MIFLGNLAKVTDTKYTIGLIHNFPNMIPASMLESGILVEVLPIPEVRDGKMAVLYCNPSTKEVWHEYVPAPPAPETLEQQIDQLKNDKLNLELTIAQLVEKQEKDKTELQLAIAEILEGSM